MGAPGSGRPAGSPVSLPPAPAPNHGVQTSLTQEGTRKGERMPNAHSSTTQSISWLRLLMLGGLVCLTVGVSRARANAVFGNESLHGAYGVQASGQVDGNALASTGRISFDGRGGCTYVTTMNIEPGGVLGPISTTSCTYSVNRVVP